MSVLVACRGLRAAPHQVESVPVSGMSPSTSYQEALAYWGVENPEEWVAVPTWDAVLWDDLLRDALASREGLLRLKEALALLAASSDEAAIWYAGFPDEVPVASDPDEFARLVGAQVVAEDLEPAARMIRRKPPTRKAAVDGAKNDPKGAGQIVTDKATTKQAQHYHSVKSDGSRVSDPGKTHYNTRGDKPKPEE